MSYTALNHDYQNTGGGCMVSSFQLYDDTAKRTLFLLLDDGSGSITLADYVMNDIEYSEDLIIETVLFDDLQPSNPNFELYRSCLINHVKKSYQYDQATTYVPYDMLSDDLQQQMSEEYVQWHKQEEGNRFETDGKRIIYNKKFIADHEEPTMSHSLYKAIASFRAASQNLAYEFSKEHYEKMNVNYPFADSFDEVNLQIDGWCDTMVDGAFIYDLKNVRDPKVFVLSSSDASMLRDILHDALDDACGGEKYDAILELLQKM